MSIQKRNIIIGIFLVMSFIPFLLLTDLFPFMRFGMFAETVNNKSQQELFEVSILKEDGSIEPLSKRQQVMDDSHLNYLTRTYYYNNNISYFVNEISQSGLVLPHEKIIITHKKLTGKIWTNTVISAQP